MPDDLTQYIKNELEEIRNGKDSNIDREGKK